jgi:Bacterial Ig-like domain (group 2)
MRSAVRTCSTDDKCGTQPSALALSSDRTSGAVGQTLGSMQKLMAALTVVLLVMIGPGCEGFFVDPVLTGLTVGPSATVQTGGSIQMSAVGTYNDGSQKTLSGVYWSSNPPTVATVSASGLVTGVEPGQTTITGAKETASGTATVTVTVGGLSSIRITTQDGLTNIAYGESEQFIATGTANGEQIDITDSVTWSTSPSSISGVSIAPSTGLLTTTSGPSTAAQFQVVATDPTTGITGQMTFIVHP